MRLQLCERVLGTALWTSLNPPRRLELTLPSHWIDGYLHIYQVTHLDYEPIWMGPPRRGASRHYSQMALFAGLVEYVHERIGAALAQRLNRDMDELQNWIVTRQEEEDKVAAWHLDVCGLQLLLEQEVMGRNAVTGRDGAMLYGFELLTGRITVLGQYPW